MHVLSEAMKKRYKFLIYLGIPILAIAYCSSKNNPEVAKLYAEKVIYELDLVYVADGKYPGSLDEIYSKVGKPPEPIKAPSFYSVHENEYRLDFYTVGGMFPVAYRYSSKDKKWEVSD